MAYKFYIRMDGEIYGPYSAKGMLDLGVLPDIMVTEISLNVWQTADNFNFQDLAKKEMLEKLKATAATDEVASSPNIEEKRSALKNRLMNQAPNIQLQQAPIMPTAQFPSSIEYKANFNEGLNSIGGKIIITPTQLIFHPHSINFGNLQDRVYEIAQILGYEKGILMFMHISFVNGERIKLTVWNKTEIIEQLEARRKNLAQ